MTHTPWPEINVSESVAAGLRTLRWEWDNLEPSEAEDDTQGWHPDPDHIDITAYRNRDEGQPGARRSSPSRA